MSKKVKNRIQDNNWLMTKPIAHRGLWGNGVVENTREAYLNAADKSIPIEIDLYFTKDKEVVSFHDSTLNRMLGIDGKIWDFTLDELKTHTILGSKNETIPTFKEVLSIAKGRSPILIEIKKQPIPGLIDAIIDILKDYDGEYAIQSFDPRYIIRAKKLAPNIIRGVLSTSDFVESMPLFQKIVCKHMLLNFIAKPDFISYDWRDYPLKKRKVKNKRKLAWTLTSDSDYQKVKPYVDNVIYEGFNITK